MKPFMDADFLLENDVAKKLYHEHAEKMPIYDYHCHIPPAQIAENHRFANIGELMLGGDHYKWRVMLSNGVDEKYIRGDASWHDKWLAFASSLKYCVGNPMYHWTHLELQRVFGITDILSEKTAEDIWNRANAMLATDEFRCHGLIEKFGVKLICTTDDPVDDLKYHEEIAKQGNSFKVYPAWRPDKLLNIERGGFTDYIGKLSRVSGIQCLNLDSLMKAIERRQQEQAQLQEKAAVLEQKAAVSAAEAAAAKALVQDKQAQLAGKELPAEPQELAHQYQQREASWQAAEKAAVAAEQDYHSLDTRYHAAQSAWKTKREELLRSQQQAAALQQSFAGRLVQAGFADEAAYEAALQGSWRASDYRDKVRRELLSHEQALHTARTNLANCQKTIEKLEKPDLAAAEDAASAAQAAWQQALRESSAAETVLRSWQKRQKDLDALREQSGELTQTYARITGLSELASGKTGSRVSFQTYVLHSLLDDVMEMANQRLLIMSRGQYELHAGQRQRANQQGGLDMEIFDHYSGYARPLATLSGGESFLASLALALGLADVVQACAGGVRLDTMFIDEGFGTLDSETLDVALKALFELQKSGRLIGIISHVEELRSRIPARLEVTKTKSGGSTAHFELGTAES